jgi:hypothetical protein
LFFGIEFVISILTIGDVAAAIPLLLWSILLAWWSVVSIRQQRRLAKAHKEFIRSHKF